MLLEQRQDQEQTQETGLFVQLTRRFYHILRRYPLDPIELVGAAQCTLYGLFLLSPLQTFASSKGFRAVAEFMNEDTAGALFLTIGIVWFSGLLLEYRPTRIGASLLSTFLFVYWAVMLGKGNIDGGGWLTYGMFAAISVWSFWRSCVRQVKPD